MVLGMMTFGLLMMLIGLLVMVGIVALAIWVLVRFSGLGRRDRASRSHSRKILDRRYAAGEVDHEEYERIRRELG